MFNPEYTGRISTQASWTRMHLRYLVRVKNARFADAYFTPISTAEAQQMLVFLAYAIKGSTIKL
jgi:hypothetical protein